MGSSRLWDRTDSEVVSLLRMNGGAVCQTFERLVQLLGDEVRAAHAMREENLYVTTHQDVPTGEKLGAFVRNYMKVNALTWNQDNLDSAVFHYKEIHGQ